MRSGALAGIGAAAIVAVGGALAWFALSETEETPADDPPAPRRATSGGEPDPVPPAQGDAPVREPRRPLPPPPREEKIAPPPPLSAEPEPGAGLTLGLAGYEEALGAIDWNRAGVAARGALEAARRAVHDIPRGLDPDECADRVARANEALFATAQPVSLLLMRSTPGTRPEAGAEHPAFVANALAAALRAFHRPLSEAQVEALRSATESALSSDVERLRDGPPVPPGPLSDGAAAEGALARWVALTAHRRTFRDALYALLDDPQRRVVLPDAVRDRAGLDVFGPAFGWARRLEPVPVPAEARWSEVALGRIAGPAAPEPSQIPGLRRAVEAWFAARAAGPFVVREGELSRRGFPTLDECLTAARATVSLLDHVARDGGLRPAQVAGLRSLDVALVLERAE